MLQESPVAEDVFQPTHQRELKKIWWWSKARRFDSDDTKVTLRKAVAAAIQKRILIFGQLIKF